MGSWREVILKKKKRFYAVEAYLFVFVWVRATMSLSPRMELPPLSPGIHDNVIDVVVVLVTVRRGWSGGTEEKSKVQSSCLLVKIQCILYNKQYGDPC